MFCIMSCKQDRQELIFESVSFALINLKCLFSRSVSNLFFSKENRVKMRLVMRSGRTAAEVGASRPSSVPFLPQHSLRLRIGLNWSNPFLTWERAGKIRRNASREVCFVTAYSPSYQEVSYLHLSFILASNRKTKTTCRAEYFFFLPLRPAFPLFTLLA